MFFILAGSILVLGYAYIVWRIFGPMDNHFPFKGVLWALLIGLMILPFGHLAVRWWRINIFLGEEMAWLTFMSLGFFSFVFTLLLCRDLPFLFVNLTRPILSTFFFRNHDPSRNRLDVPERRKFLIQSTNIGILGLSGALSGMGLLNARKAPGTVHVSIPIRNLSPALESLRIVQITDIHVSPTLRRDYVQSVVTQVNSLDPHVIVFTGDLADGSVSRFQREVAPLGDLSAQYGVYFVTGNHEYYSGVNAWVAEAKRLNMTVLLNEYDMITHDQEPFVLAGVTDYSGGWFFKDHVSDPRKAVGGAPKDRLRILLAHQPRSIYSAAAAGIDLQISGHTHGGQFYPWQFLVSLQQPYLAGLHMHDHTAIYVSRGTGYWGPPIRLGAPSEITLITLNRVK